MKKSIKLFLAVLMMLTLIGSLSAQSVTLKMKRPPIGRLSAADLWSATITNTGEAFTAYLYGSMTNNETSELIATGQTMTFEVKKGTTNFKVSDLPRIPDINYTAKDPKYKTSFMNTGGAPAGDYKICIELRTQGNEVTGEDCIDQKITGGDAPQLISPRDEEELRIDNPIFTWIHMKAPGANQTYSLKIVELRGEESPEIAMQKNKTFFEKEGIPTQLFQYPNSAEKFEKGMKYAWQISINGMNSSVHTFSTNNTHKIGTVDNGANLYLMQRGDGCCFNVNINSSGSWNSCQIISNSNPIISASPDQSTTIPAVLPPSVSSIKWNGNGPFTQGWNMYGIICFQNTGSFQIYVKWSSNGGNSFVGTDTLNVYCSNGQSNPDSCIMCNSDFENPILSSLTTTFYVQLHQDNFPCWKTTASNHKIEFWSYRPDLGQNVPAYHGNQFAELNCDEVATLYQSFTVNTIGTKTIYFAHRGRFGVDVMGVSVGPVGGPYNLLGSYSDGNTAWSYNSVSYNFSSVGQYEIRFESISSSGNNPAGGNFLDAISVDCPIAPGTGTPTQTGSICDSLKATVSSSPLQGCCWSINLRTPVNNSSIRGIQFLAQAPNTFVTANSQLGSAYNSGWIYPVNNGQEFRIKRLMGNIPSGQLNGFFNFCLNKLSSPQHIIVNWLNAGDTVLCSDTVTTYCEIPCVTFTQDTLVCNGSNYNLRYSFTNNASYSIGNIDVVSSTPSGITVSPSTFILSPALGTGQTTNLPVFTLSGAIPNTQACIVFKFTSPDGCCWCYDTLCVTIPSCVCNEVGATITGDPLNCCYSLNLQNNYSGNYFNQINVRPLESGISFSTWNTNTANNWYSTNTYPDNVIYLINNPANFPNNYIPMGNSANVINFCLHGYTTSSQHVVIEWMRNDSVKCRDTLTTNCSPLPAPTNCTQLINDSLTCLQNGTYQYTFHIRNNSSHTTTGFQFNPVSPAGLTFTPANFSNVTIAPGMISPQQTMIVGGVSPGSSFCFKISLYEHVLIAGQQYYDWCCYSDTICKIAPICVSSDSCRCGHWESDKVVLSDLTTTKTIYCGKTYNNVNPINNLTISYPDYVCSSKKCNATYIWTITGTIPQSGTGNTIPNANLSLPGSYIISMTPICGTDTCKPCQIFINVKGNPSDSLCGCGERWKPNSSIIYNPKLTSKEERKVKCFSDEFFGPIVGGSNIIYSASPYTCDKPGCLPTYKWRIVDLATNSNVNSGTSNSLPITFPVPLPESKYEFIVYPVCGGKVCDSCGFYFYTEGKSDCECGGWKSKTIGGTINAKKIHSIECGEKFKVDFLSNLTLNFPAYICKPENCEATYTWDLIGGSGINPVHVTGNSNTFNYTFNTPGNYSLSLKAYCEGKPCDSCIVYINVPDRPHTNDSCMCGKWGGEEIGVIIDGKKQENTICGKKIEIYSNSSLTLTFPDYYCIGNCKADYTWDLKGGSGFAPIHVTGIGNPFTYTFNTPGNYSLWFKPFCGGSACDSCTINISVIKIPHTQGCDSSLNKVSHNMTTFIGSFEGAYIEFTTNFNGTPITDPGAQQSFAVWQWNDVTFNNVSSYWNQAMYIGANQSPVMSIVFPPCTYKNVGFELEQFWSNPGAYTIKIYTCDSNCSYTYITNFQEKSYMYFGFNCPAYINKIEVSMNVSGCLMRHFKYGI